MGYMHLTKEEKLVLIFLAASFLVGLGVNFYKNKNLPNENFKNLPQIVDKEYAKININKAGFKKLITLKGIGAKTAIRIIDYREENGLFFSREDIMQVMGIGQGKYDKIKDYIIAQ